MPENLSGSPPRETVSMPGIHRPVRAEFPGNCQRFLALAKMSGDRSSGVGITCPPPPGDCHEVVDFFHHAKPLEACPRSWHLV